jgi:hypothetical protein
MLNGGQRCHFKLTIGHQIENGDLSFHSGNHATFIREGNAPHFFGRLPGFFFAIGMGAMNAAVFNVNPPQALCGVVPDRRLADLGWLMGEQLKVAHEKTDGKRNLFCYIDNAPAQVVSCRTS